MSVRRETDFHVPLLDRGGKPARGVAARADWGDRLKALAEGHRCFNHPLFTTLGQLCPSRRQVAALLRNYDAHASVLRRLLLKAATVMPEEAVGYVLENVRNEYGNGNPAARHQLQLIDVARCAGVTDEEFRRERVRPGVRDYIRLVTAFYFPLAGALPRGFRRPAVAAGAVTATEILAIREFEQMQKAFSRLGLENHIWFDHVRVEVEHSDESLSLALHFIEREGAWREVEFGLSGVLDANVRLYDGLLESLNVRPRH